MKGEAGDNALKGDMGDPGQFTNVVIGGGVIVWWRWWCYSVVEMVVL